MILESFPAGINQGWYGYTIVYVRLEYSPTQPFTQHLKVTEEYLHCGRKPQCPEGQGGAHNPQQGVQPVGRLKLTQIHTEESWALLIRNDSMLCNLWETIEHFGSGEAIKAVLRLVLEAHSSNQRILLSNLLCMYIKQTRPELSPRK